MAGTLDLTSCATGWNNTGLLSGWLAVVGALLGLALWGAGVVSRRVKLSGFYSEPCFHTAFALTVGAYSSRPWRRGLSAVKPMCSRRRPSA